MTVESRIRIRAINDQGTPANEEPHLTVSAPTGYGYPYVRLTLPDGTSVVVSARELKAAIVNAENCP